MNMNEKIENINIASTTFYLHFINARPDLDQLFKKTQISIIYVPSKFCTDSFNKQKYEDEGQSHIKAIICSSFFCFF